MRDHKSVLMYWYLSVGDGLDGLWSGGRVLCGIVKRQKLLVYTLKASRMKKGQLFVAAIVVAMGALCASEGMAQNTFPSSGNVGIGTLSPVASLHVNDGLIRITGMNSGGGPMVVFGGDPSGVAPAGEWGIEYMPADKGLNFWRPFGATNSAGTGGAPYMNYVLFLDDDNQIGINTKDPIADLTVNGKAVIGDPALVTMPSSYRLYVAGGILTERVRIAQVGSGNWADYVFEPGYKLRSLEEVEAYVQKNGHLPQIPSACEVEEAGVDLVEINSLLLMKVEELTLYIIAQNKRIAALEQAAAK